MATPVKTVSDFYLARPGEPAFINALLSTRLALPTVTGLTTGTIKVTAFESQADSVFAGVLTLSYRGVITPPWQNPADGASYGLVGNLYTSAFADGSYGFVWDQRGTVPSTSATDQNVYGRSPVSTQTTGSATTFGIATTATTNDFVVDSLVTTDGRVASLISGGTSIAPTLRLVFTNADGSGLSFVSLDPIAASGGYLPWLQMAQLADGSFQIFALTDGNLLIKSISAAGVPGDWLNTYDLTGAPPPIKSHDVAAVVGSNGSNQGTLQIFEENLSATSWKLTLHYNFGSGGNGGGVTVANGSQSAATDAHNAQIAQLRDGRFVVVWDDAGVVYGRLASILGSRTPTLEGLTFVVAQGPAGTGANRPTIDVLADGRFAVAWQEAGLYFGLPYVASKMNIFDPREAAVVLNAVAAGSGFVGTAFGDTMTGGVGSDSFDGAGGADSLNGGLGNDEIDGGAGADIMVGGGGIDLLSYATASSGVLFYMLAPSLNSGDAAGDIYSGFQNVRGSGFNDRIYMDNGANSVEGGGGAFDTVELYAGNDSYTGGTGFDYVLAGAGNDVITVGDGGSLIYGEDGDDAITATAGSNNLNGGIGNDTLTGGTGQDVILGGAGLDSILGGSGDDFLFGEDGNDTISGDAGNDQIQGGIGLDSLAGGANVDVIQGGADNDSIDGGSEDDFLFGEAGNDTVLGGAGNDQVFGGTENDSLVGNAGVDILNGGDGNDTLNDGGTGELTFSIGGNGNDTIFGTSGQDQMWGGTGSLDTGSDVFVFGASNGYDIIFDFQAGPGVVDQIRLVGTGITSFAQLLAENRIGQAGANTQINLPGAGNVIFLINTTAATLVADDFLFA